MKQVCPHCGRLTVAIPHHLKGRTENRCNECGGIIEVFHHQRKLKLPNIRRPR